MDEQLVDEVAGGGRGAHVAPGVRASPPGKYECFCSETYSNSRMNALELQNEQRAAVKSENGGEAGAHDGRTAARGCS